MTAMKEKFGQEKCTQMESASAGDGLEADGLGMVSVGRPLGSFQANPPSLLESQDCPLPKAILPLRY